jgi:site-specific DNA-cytosine methylase
MSKSIKWGCIQPLTGGMYLGAEKAIGTPAAWIISYPGLTDLVVDKKTGEVVDAANERNLVNYLTKHNRMPDYFVMNRTMTQNDEDLTPEYRLNGEVTTPDLVDMDLVVSVPVCAGLTMGSNPVTRADRKDEMNCQMIWMTKYVLKGIKPKVYLFENAPTLMSGRGDEVRDQLETIAKESGYSVVYYKTDTKYHENCQKRPRTFIFFFRNRDGHTFIPELKFENIKVSVNEFFATMPKLREDDPMNVELDNDCWVKPTLEYAQKRFGDAWRDNVITSDVFEFVVRNKEEREPFIEFVKANYPEDYVKKYTRYLNHIDEKLADGLGFWSVTPKVFDDCTPACMYKNMPITVHHSENRLYTMREWLFLMGHPTDFDMIGIPWNYFRKIGQNVPANTARWVASETVRIISNWDNETSVDNGQNVAFFDNSKRKRIW